MHIGDNVEIEIIVPRENPQAQPAPDPQRAVPQPAPAREPEKVEA